MELKEIDKMPEFECDIDPMTFSKLSEGDQLLAEAMSINRQQVSWLAEKTIIAHNTAIQTHELLLSVIKWVGGTVGVIIVEEIIRRLFIQ